MKLGFLLLELFDFCLEFSCEDDVMKLSMLLDFICQFFKFIFEVFPVQDNLLVFATELGELFIESDDFVFDWIEFAFVVFPAHLVLFELPEQWLQFVSFEAISSERFLEFVVGVPQFEDFFLVFLGFLIDPFNFVTMLFD